MDVVFVREVEDVVEGGVDFKEVVIGVFQAVVVGLGLGAFGGEGEEVAAIEVSAGVALLKLPFPGAVDEGLPEIGPEGEVFGILVSDEGGFDASRAGERAGLWKRCGAAEFEEILRLGGIGVLREVRRRLVFGAARHDASRALYWGRRG